MTPKLAAAMLTDMHREAQRINSTDIDCRLAEIRKAVYPDEQAQLWASVLKDYADRASHPTLRDILENAAIDMEVNIKYLKQERALEESHEEQRVREFQARR